MTEKTWLQSRTILFNLLIIVLDVVINQTALFQSLLPEHYYGWLLVFVALVNTYLRLSTRTVIKQP